VARKQGRGAEKASAHAFRISDFLVFFFNPHSAIYNPQFGEAGPWAIHRIAPTRGQAEDVVLALCPPSPRNEMRLMVFSRHALASWPANP